MPDPSVIPFAVCRPVYNQGCSYAASSWLHEQKWIHVASTCCVEFFSVLLMHPFNSKTGIASSGRGRVRHTRLQIGRRGVRQAPRRRPGPATCGLSSHRGFCYQAPKQRAACWEKKACTDLRQHMAPEIIRPFKATAKAALKREFSWKSVNILLGSNRLARYSLLIPYMSHAYRQSSVGKAARAVANKCNES